MPERRPGYETTKDIKLLKRYLKSALAFIDITGQRKNYEYFLEFCDEENIGR